MGLVANYLKRKRLLEPRPGLELPVIEGFYLPIDLTKVPSGGQ